MEPVPTVTPIPSDADPGALVGVVLRAVEAAEQQEYAVAAGFLLMVVTFAAVRASVVQRYVPKDYVATALLGVAVLGGFGASLASGLSPARAAIAFLLCSATAIAFWEGIAKHAVRWWRRRREARAGAEA